MTTRDFWAFCMRCDTAPQMAKKCAPSKDFPFELASFQHDAVGALMGIIEQYRGAVLADAVGLGKTRMALACVDAAMAQLSGAEDGIIYFCVPARLVDNWQAMISRMSRFKYRRYEIITHTFLSQARLDMPAKSCRMVVVDEAHQFRNPNTNRYKNLAVLCAYSPVLLLTATPICNSIWDIYHLLKLFMAEDACRGVIGKDLSDAFKLAETAQYDLSRLLEMLVVQRLNIPARMDDATQLLRRPTASIEVYQYKPHENEEWLLENLTKALESLKFELLQETWPVGLLREYLLHRWESSAYACYQSVFYIVEYYAVWLNYARQGKYLSRRDFRKVFGSTSDFAQPPLPYVFDILLSTDNDFCVEQIERIAHEKKHLEALVNRLENAVTEGVQGTLELVGAILGHVADAKIVIFTGYQHTAQHLYKRLCKQFGMTISVALVSSKQAIATGLGITNARDIVMRFSPHANGAKFKQQQQIQLLVCTDCMSSGQNLQDCNQMILMDLPYSPRVLEQRIGRLTRAGSPHEKVFVYLPRANGWRDSLGAKTRLIQKLSASESVGLYYKSLSQNDRRNDAHNDHLSSAAQYQELTASWGINSISSNSDEGLMAPKLYECTTDCASKMLVCVAAQSGERRRVQWWVIDEEGRLITRLSTVVLQLSALIKTPRAIRQSDNLSWFNQAKAHLMREQQRINAVFYAPAPIPKDSAQHVLWEKFDGYAWRSKLLVALPRGQELILWQALYENWSAERVKECIFTMHRYRKSAKPEILSIVGLLVY